MKKIYKDLYLSMKDYYKLLSGNGLKLTNWIIFKDWIFRLKLRIKQFLRS